MVRRKGVMSKMKNDSAKVRALALSFVFMSILLTSAHSFVSSEEKASPLVMKLTITDIDICARSSLTAEVEIVNISKEEWAIDPQLMFYQTVFDKFISKRGKFSIGSKTKIGDPGPDYESKFLVLKPGQSYKRDIKVSLADGFFQDISRYTMKVTYGQFRESMANEVKVFRGTVTSNDVSFNIVNCKAKKRGQKANSNKDSD
jgi:hypothetical protein